MTIPLFHLKYQADPSNRTTPLGDIAISRAPLIIDFSSTYPNNQESAVSINPYPVISSEVNISGIVGDFIFTDKTLDNGTFLFYEYQPLYDVASSGFLVRNLDGDLIQHRIEYAHIEPTDASPNRKFLLSQNDAIDYDTLNGRSEIGQPTGPFTFAPTPSPSGGLGYVTHADSLAISNVTVFREFDGRPLPASGVIDFTFLSSSASSYDDCLYADDWGIRIGSGLASVRVDATTSSTIPIDDETWYRGRMYYNQQKTTLEVWRDTLIGQATINDAINPSGFSIFCDSFYINNLTLYDNPQAIDWELPPICPRYHHALRWNPFPIDQVPPYRVRILTETNDPATIVYDAYKPGGLIQQNRLEDMNLVPIYKETITETQDWATSGSSLVLNGPIEQASTIYLKPLFEGFISVDVIQNNIVVTNGKFKSSPYDTDDGKYLYELLEYEDMMPFEVDNQNLVIPRSLKEAKFKAIVLSAYEVQILPMVVYEGTYPNYTEPLTEDIEKTVNDNGDTVTSSTGTIEFMTWRKTRGIRVYVNGAQLPQAAISGFDFNRGIIRLETPVLPEDNVEVTYLRKVNYFVCNYPRMKPELVSGNSWRIYLRPNWPNYFLENPSDTLERLAYRMLINGEPTGNLRSCVSNEIVTEPEATIKLADISLIPTVTFKDARVFGGGLVSDTEFGSKEIRRNKHKPSVFFSDIAKFQSTAPENFSNNIPWPTIFVRIPNAVRLAIEGRFSTKESALEYIKKTIEKHMALGVFYVIIDENNNLWEKPFPSTSVTPQNQANIELP